MRFRRDAVLTVLFAALLALSAGPAWAVVWSGTTDNTWGTNANWGGNPFPNAVDAIADISQKNIAGATTITLGAGRTVGSLLIGDTDGDFSYTLDRSGTTGTQTLTFDVASGNASLTQISSSKGDTITANVPLALNDSLDITNNSSNALTIASIISGGATKAVNVLAGTVNLNAANTFTGGVNIKGGTVSLGSSSNGLGAKADLTIGDTASTGKLVINQRSPVLKSLNSVGLGGSIVGGNGTAGSLTIDTASATTSTFAGTLGGGGTNENNFTLTKDGLGTLALNGTANSVTGTLTLNYGTLKTTAISGTPFGVGSLALTGDVVEIAPSGSGSDVVITAAGATNKGLTYSGGVQLKLNKGSQNSLTFTAGNGTGTLARSNGGVLIVTPSALANFGVSEKFKFAGTAPGLAAGMASAAIVVREAGSTTADFTTYDGTDGFKKVTYDQTDFTGSDNTKKINLASAQTLSADTAAFAVRADFNISIDSTKTLTIGNGSAQAGLLLHDGAAIAPTSGAATLAFGAANAVIYAEQDSIISANISGTNGITKFGAGTLIYKGTTAWDASAGTGNTDLIVADAGAFQFNGELANFSVTKALRLHNNAKLILGGTSGKADVTAATGAAYVDRLGASVVGGASTVSTLTIDGAQTINATLGGAGTNENNLALTFTGAGTKTLVGSSNTFAGGLNIQGGLVNGNAETTNVAGGSFGTGNIAISGGAVLDVNYVGDSQRYLASSRTITVGGTMASPSTIRAEGGSSWCLMVQSKITGSGAVKLQMLNSQWCPQIAIENSNNDYTGGTIFAFNNNQDSAYVGQTAKLGSGAVQLQFTGTGSDDDKQMNFLGNENLKFVSSDPTPITTYLPLDLNFNRASAKKLFVAFRGNAPVMGTLTSTITGTGTTGASTTVSLGDYVSVNDRYVGTKPAQPTTSQLTVGLDNGSGTFTGMIAQATGTTGSVIKDGTGAWTLTGNVPWTYTGETTIKGGKIVLGNSTVLQSSTLALTGGSLEFDVALAGVAKLGGLSGTGNLPLVDNAVTPAAVALTVGSNGASSGVYLGALSGVGASLTKIGSNSLVLSGTNTYTGGTNVNGGTLQLAQVAALPTTGTLSVASGATLAASVGGAGEFTAAGSGAGSLGGLLTSASRDPNSRLAIDTATAVGGPVTYAGTISNAQSFTKLGANTLVLTGTDTSATATTVKGGTLVLDYSAGNDHLGATSAVVVDGAKLTLKSTAAVTAKSIAGLTLGNYLGEANALTLEGSGANGVQLTVGTFTMNSTAGNTQNSNLIDLSSSTANSLTFSGIANCGVANGVLMANTTNNRANLIVKDTSGAYGFATLSGATSGTVGALTTGTTLGNATATANTGNYRIAGTTVTRSATVDFSTLTIDSTSAAVNLNMGANTLNPTGSGRGVLVYGGNDVNITGTGTIGYTTTSAGSIWIYNYVTYPAALNIAPSSSTTGDVSFIFGGPGLTNWSGTLGGTNARSHKLYADGGILRLSGAQDLTTAAGSNSLYYVSSGGVLEVGADLNGATAGDFSNAVGSANGQIRFYGDSGISASGANRVVNFGGAAATLAWGKNSFLTNVDGATDGGNTLKLSSAKSDATVELQNGIDLGSRNRVVEVANGSAATDAKLSGAISGVVALTKTGAGTLDLAGVNVFTGALGVAESKLQVSGKLLGNNVATVASGATLSILGGNGGAGGEAHLATLEGGSTELTAPTSGGAGAQLFAEHIRQTSLTIGDLGKVTITGGGGANGTSVIGTLTIALPGGGAGSLGATAVPEPGTFVLLAIAGLLGLLAWRRK